MFRRVITGLVGCALVGGHAPANAQPGAWTKARGSTYCDLRGYDFRLFGSYPGKTTAPDATLELASSESGDSTLGIQWEGPGEPRIKGATLTIDEDVDGTARLLVSVDGVVIPAIQNSASDAEEFDYEWRPSNNGKWVSALKSAREVKAVFLSAGGRPISSRTFNLASARRLSQELTRVGWRCP